MTDAKTPGIAQRDAFTVIGLPYEGPMDNHEGLSAVWHDYEKRAEEIAPRASENTGFGVFTSSPEQAAKGEMTYLACAPVTEETPVPEGMVRLEVPGGQFAMLTHVGFLTGLRDSYSRLFQWIGEQGLAPDGRPGYELYDQRFNPSSPDNEIDLYIPVSN